MAALNKYLSSKSDEEENACLEELYQSQPLRDKLQMLREFAAMRAKIPDLKDAKFLRPVTFLHARLVIKHTLEFLHDRTRPVILEHYKHTPLKNAARQEWDDAAGARLQARHNRENFPPHILSRLAQYGVDTAGTSYAERTSMEAAKEEFFTLDDWLLSMPIEPRLSTKKFLKQINDEAFIFHRE